MHAIPRACVEGSISRPSGRAAHCSARVVQTRHPYRTNTVSYSLHASWTARFVGESRPRHGTHLVGVRYTSGWFVAHFVEVPMHAIPRASVDWSILRPGGSTF